jgi:hypothetical protein
MRSSDELLAHRADSPPTSSSLAEERTPSLAPSQHGGARLPTLAARDDSADTVYDRARESFGSMIISGIAIAALVLPIVILGPRSGLEIVQPLAVVLLGGVVSSLVVALFLLPSAYLHLIPPQAAEEPPEHEDERQPITATTGA